MNSHDMQWSTLPFQQSLSQSSTSLYAASPNPSLRIQFGSSVPFHSQYDQSRGNGDFGMPSASYGHHARAHSLDGVHSLQPPKRRSRQSWYPSEEARQAAKQVQKARRREQNRNAQRRLRDRKEEHIFNLEGEVARLRKEHEAQQANEQGLEEMLRRLRAERDELQRRLSVMSASTTSPDPASQYGEGFSATSAASSSPTKAARLVRTRSSSANEPLHSAAMAGSRGSYTVDHNNALGLSGFHRTLKRSAASLEEEEEDDEDDDEEQGDIVSALSLTVSPFARAAEGRSRSMSLQMPKPVMAGQYSISMGSWDPVQPPSQLPHLNRPMPPSRDTHSSDSQRGGEPLSAQSSTSGFSGSSSSLATSPPNSASLSRSKPDGAAAFEDVVLSRPHPWQGGH